MPRRSTVQHLLRRRPPTPGAQELLAGRHRAVVRRHLHAGLLAVLVVLQLVAALVVTAVGSA